MEKEKSKTLEQKLILILRSRLTTAVRAKGNKKYYKAYNIIGCTIEFLKNYLESRFLPTMTWENYGKYWHIDHIVPCRVFDLSSSIEQRSCFHYTNLRPLFAITQTINGIEYEGNQNRKRTNKII